MTEALDSQSQSWFDRLADKLFREPKVQDELRELLEKARRSDALDEKALEMMEGILDFNHLHVRDVMIPRSQMIVIERDEPLESFIPRVIDSGHSRFPVIGEDKDDIIGILLAKDLLSYTFTNHKTRFNIKDVLRQPTFVPESKRLSILLNDFRLSHQHMAIVIDEYSGVSGLVTIEDVLEEIVGDITDEHDASEHHEPIRQTKPGEFLLQATTTIESFNQFFHANLSDDSADTIGGYIAQQFGHLPQKGETLTVADFHFQIMRADKRRIHTLTVKT